MSCPNVILKGMNTGCKDNIGGIREVYIAKKDTVSDVSITVDPSTNASIVQDVTMDASTMFYTYKVRKQTSSMTSTITTDDAVGTFSIQTDVALQFTGMTPERNYELTGVLQEDLAVIVLDQMGRYWYLGYENAVTASAGTAQTGQAIGDLNGYNITLSDISNHLPYSVNMTATLKTKIIEDAPTA